MLCTTIVVKYNDLIYLLPQKTHSLCQHFDWWKDNDLWTLKIENKTTSTRDSIKYSVIPFAGNFDITSIEENRETGDSVRDVSGGGESLLLLSGHQYPNLNT